LIQLLTHEGSADSHTVGNLAVNVIYGGYCAGNHLYRVTVTSRGFVPQPHNDGADDRPFGHPDHAQAQALAEHYANGLVQLLTYESAGIPDEQISEIAEDINTDLDTAHTARVTAYEQEQADVAAIMATSQGFRGTQTAAPASEAMERILADAAANNGRVARSKDATSVQLIALAKRGLVELTYGRRGNQRVITGGVLTSKGAKRAENKEVAA
jgi:hypothetical protein